MSIASSDKNIFFLADIGTTTIKASLAACTSEEPDGIAAPLAACSEKNAQSVYGLDVISRVLYAHHNGVEPLQKKILNQLSSMLCSLCEAICVTPDSLAGCIITGNTVMLHLVRGFSVQGFEMAPFTPVTLEPAEILSGDLYAEEMRASLDCMKEPVTRVLPPIETPVYFPPCVDAFIGADAVCAALFAMSPGPAKWWGTVHENPRYPLLIADVGTNTEIMLIRERGEVTCCSTAAGPAFEGGVLGGRYTGSSLVHLLAELLKAGAMDDTGLLDEAAAARICREDSSRSQKLYEPVKKDGKTCGELPVMTQQAVRQLQLAKGAVCAAIETLLQEEGLAVEDVGRFILCGNFGSALDIEEAECIGLFPAGLAAVTEYAGNAAELGAHLLMKDEMREKAKKIAASGKLIQLADSRFFARRYIERMNFTV